MEYPRLLRLWHWLNFLTVSGLLITVALRETFLKWRINAALMQEKLNSGGVIVPPALTDAIAKSMRDQMWQWHIYFGYVLAGLWLMRLILKILKTRSTSDFRFLPKMQNLRRISYGAFYLVVTLMVITGFSMVFKASWREIAKEAHEFMFYGILVFVIAHLIAVVVAEFTPGTSGIVSRMISGGRSDFDK